MSDAGGSSTISNVDLTFNDSAANDLPQNTIITSGNYRPTNYGAGDTFPAPAPAPSAATTLSTFNSTDPNGTWSLYVVDDTGGDSGSISGGWCLQITTTLVNSPPTFTAPTITTPIDENGIATLSGSISDPDVGDTFTLTIFWEDGSLPEVFNYPAAPAAFNHNHQYLDNGLYNVGLLLQDSAGNSYFESLSLTVDNVAPTVNAGADITTTAGKAVIFNGSFNDPGSLDTHTIEWDFGDGSSAGGTLTPAHVYAAAGDYMVTLTVTDKDGGIGTDELTVQVLNTLYLPFIVKP
jgi:PKD repeat protein